MQRHFVERRSWEDATPTLQDPDCVPDSSTLRRWGGGIDLSQPATSFLRQILARVTHWLERGKQADTQTFLSGLLPALQVLCPLRL
jgi:hypothetical protein